MKLNKYNHIKENVVSGTIISTGTSSSNTQPINLDRSIWGQHDAGNNIGGSILINGNGFIVSQDADNPENTEVILNSYQNMFNDEGNLYVEKGIKAESANLKNLEADFGDISTLISKDVSTNTLFSKEIKSHNLNTSIGYIHEISGDKLNYNNAQLLKAFIN